MKSLLKTILLWAYSVVRSEKGPKAVFYHDVGTKYTPMGTDEKIFWTHMKILGSRAEGVGSSDVVCLDDGFRGAWEHREQFRKMGIRPFVSIAVRLVGEPGYLTWDEIRELQNDYGFTFVNHTWSHQTLAGGMIDESPIEERTEAWYERELVASKQKIEAEIGRPVDTLCFPVGLVSEAVIERCKRAGYRQVYASYPGNVTNDYVQPRCLCQDLSPLAFRAALNGGLNFFRARYRKRHWVE